jgi:hypothetical protein
VNPKPNASNLPERERHLICSVLDITREPLKRRKARFFFLFDYYYYYYYFFFMSAFTGADYLTLDSESASST